MTLRAVAYQGRVVCGLVEGTTNTLEAQTTNARRHGSKKRVLGRLAFGGRPPLAFTFLAPWRGRADAEQGQERLPPIMMARARVHVAGGE